MRKSSQVLVYIDVAKALEAGVKFELSSNGVVLSKGDDAGFIRPVFFDKVVDVKTGKEVEAWMAVEGAEKLDAESAAGEAESPQAL